ncbi:MAG: CotH kinase family protein [Spirochaetales bacterium]|nr:CotH kinase family protein [Spirochaetales bacterium]
MFDLKNVFILLTLFCFLLVIISCKSEPELQYSIEPFESKKSAVVFNPDILQTYSLTITEGNWKRMNRNAKNTIEEYIPASLKAGNYEIGKVGLRYKGNYTLWNCFDPQGNKLCKKLSLKIRFDKFNSKKRFYGLKRLNFHSMNTDSSMMKERLAYSIFRDMNIFTSRVTHAKVYINNEFAGVFALIEQIDGRFTDNRFPGNGDGNLYKSTWPDSDNPWRYDWGLKTNKDAAPPGVNNKKICQFYKELRAAHNTDEQIGVIEKWWDIDELMKYFVVSDAINNWDGPTAYWCGDWNGDGKIQCGNDNFYIYQEEKADKFHLFAWDLTTVFDISSPFAEIGIPLWYDLPGDCSEEVLYPFGNSADNSGKVPDYVGAPNCDLFFQTLAAIKRHEGNYKGIYEKYAEELAAGPFSLQSLYEKIDTWTRQISEAVKIDTYGPGVEEWHNALLRLKENLVVLHGKLTNHLKSSI